MAIFPANDAFADSASVTVAQIQDRLTALLLAARQLPGGRGPETVEISAGQITVTQSLVWVDTEGAASSDNLDNILAPDLPDGSLIVLMPFAGNRRVDVRARQGGAGVIDLAGDGNPTVSLDAVNKAILLRKNGTRWTEVAVRASGTPYQRSGSIAFNASGTWTVPEGVTRISLTAIGGGGGGGGGAGTNTDGSPATAGSNGGSGGDTVVAGIEGGDLTAIGGSGGQGGGADGRGGEAQGAGGGLRGDNSYGTAGGRTTRGLYPTSADAFDGRGKGGNGGAGANANTGHTGGGGGASGQPGGFRPLHALASVTPGATITITIGAGGTAGSGGAGTHASGSDGGAGQAGHVRIVY